MTENVEKQGNVGILVIGAGMAGLTAARELAAAGREVLVIDKGRGVGGRLASRRIGPATFDHGAQFITARDPRFEALLEECGRAGQAAEWYRGAGDGHARWRGAPSMTAIAKYLARDLKVLLEQRAVRLAPAAQGWVVTLESGETLQAGAVILTPPVPQSLAVLEAGGVSLPPSLRQRLEDIQYEPCLALMATLDGPSKIPAPGGLALSEGPLGWLGDNQQKGISAAPAVTLHATPAFSAAHWEADRQQTAAEMLRAAAPWLGAGVIDFQMHAWRYARPARVEPEQCVSLPGLPALVLAGDAFGGQRVEGAALSGWAAAQEIQRLFQRAG